MRIFNETDLIAAMLITILAMPHLPWPMRRRC